MEESIIRKHLRGIHTLVFVALFAAFISFAFTFVLFRELSIPLEYLQEHKFNTLQSKVNNILITRLNGRMDIELQMAIYQMTELERITTGEIKDQAGKAIHETKTLLEMLRKSHL